jgi:hypothetical protein
MDSRALVVIDGPGGQVVLGHPERRLDREQPVVGADHELRARVRQVGDAALPPGQRAGLGLQGAVDRLVGAHELDEPVAFDRHLPPTARSALVTCSSIPRSVRRARSDRYWGKSRFWTHRESCPRMWCDASRSRCGCRGACYRADDLNLDAVGSVAGEQCQRSDESPPTKCPTLTTDRRAPRPAGVITDSLLDLPQRMTADRR